MLAVLLSKGVATLCASASIYNTLCRGSKDAYDGVYFLSSMLGDGGIAGEWLLIATLLSNLIALLN